MLQSELVLKLAPWGCIFFAGIAWGLSFSLSKIVVEAGFEPLGITLFQAFIAAISLYIVCLLRRRPLRVIITNIRLVVAIALLHSVLPGPIIFISIDHLQAGIVTIIIALVPMMTYGISIPFGIEKFNRIRIMGLVMGMVAILLILLPENSLPDRAAVPWILFVMLAALCYAFEGIVLSLRSAATVGPVRLAMGANACAVLMLTPFVYWTDTFAWPGFAVSVTNLSLVGLGVISALALTTFMHAVSQYGPIFATQTGYIVTISGVFWGMAIFGDVHSFWIWGALATMIIGLGLVQPNKAQQ
jgi:drug/metabolite transporter (DMT)-like permease